MMDHFIGLEGWNISTKLVFWSISPNSSKCEDDLAASNLAVLPSSNQFARPVAP